MVKQTGIIVFMVVVFAALLIAGCTSSSDSENVNTVSTEAGGWNFTADLEGNWSSVSKRNPVDFDMSGLEFLCNDYLIEQNIDTDSLNYNNWKVSIFDNVFWLPKELGADIDPENVPDILDYQEDILANVGIRIFKIPEEVQDWDTQDIFNVIGDCSKTHDVEDTDFNGRPAQIYEVDHEEIFSDEGEPMSPALRFGGIFILITDDTVVDIDVVTLPESDLSPRDVIDSFKISPA
jgi:hypothetical protein